MSQVAVEKINGNKKSQPVFLEIAKRFDALQQRAFDLFEKRGREVGHDLEDWLQAERELDWSPASELVDDGNEFKARLSLPGFEAKDVHVSAMPDALVVQAAATHTHEEKDSNVRFCEFSDKKLFRRLDLPASIDVNTVSASLDKGILQVIAPKTTAKQLAAVESNAETAKA